MPWLDFGLFQNPKTARSYGWRPFGINSISRFDPEVRKSPASYATNNLEMTEEKRHELARRTWGVEARH